MRDAGERRLVVERRREHGRRLDEEPLRALLAHALRRVAEEPHAPLVRAVVEAHRCAVALEGAAVDERDQVAAALVGMAVEVLDPLDERRRVAQLVADECERRLVGAVRHARRRESPRARRSACWRSGSARRRTRRGCRRAARRSAPAAVRPAARGRAGRVPRAARLPPAAARFPRARRNGNASCGRRLAAGRAVRLGSGVAGLVGIGGRPGPRAQTPQRLRLALPSWTRCRRPPARPRDLGLVDMCRKCSRRAALWNSPV